MLLEEAAKKQGIEILDSEVDIDHVHVLASLPLDLSPLRAVGYLKGMSAKGLFILYAPLRSVYPKGHLWSPSKFIGSVGYITLDKAKEYLEAHHAKVIYSSLTGIPAPQRSGGVAPLGAIL